MSFEDMIRAKIQERLLQIAQELKAAIEYEFSVEYGKVDIGEPSISEYSIIFDLSGLSAFEKELLNDVYYNNARKRIQKGGE